MKWSYFPRRLPWLALGITLVHVLLADAAVMSAETSRVVNVYILAGQSNMVGMGRVALDLNANGGQGSLGYLVKNPDTAKKYANLVDADCTWKTRSDVGEAMGEAMLKLSPQK